MQMYSFLESTMHKLILHNNLTPRVIGIQGVPLHNGTTMSNMLKLYVQYTYIILHLHLTTSVY